MKFYCNPLGLAEFCSVGDEGSAESLAYAVGCFVSWVEGEYFYSQMHLPLNEDILLIFSHELLHAAELDMTWGEWRVVSDLLQEAFLGLDLKEMNALILSGELTSFIADLEVDDLGRVTEYSLHLSFENEAHLEELYAIAGTVFSRLPADLEEHYARYFVDRQAIVRMNWDNLGVDHYMQLQAEIDVINESS